MTPNLSRQQIETSRIKKKKVVYWGTTFVLGYLLILILFGEVSIPHFLSMRKAYQKMQSEISELKSENGRLKIESEALRSNPEQIEKLAREELGFSKKGEIIYEFPNSEPSGHLPLKK
jgi:cell division protein FtsB